MEQCGFSESVEIEIKNGNLILKPTEGRTGWAESFQSMAANGDDELLIDDLISTKYDEEWEW